MSEDKEKRSYAKASYKTKPHTVRFDIEKFDFFMSREKLKTAQQLVDHFLNGYWWEWKVAKPTHKDVPPLPQKEEPKPVNQRNSIWGKQPKQPTFKTVADYSAEKKELESEEDYNKWLAALKADTNITPKQKDLLIKYN